MRREGDIIIKHIKMGPKKEYQRKNIWRKEILKSKSIYEFTNNFLDEIISKFIEEKEFVKRGFFLTTLLSSAKLSSFAKLKVKAINKILSYPFFLIPINYVFLVLFYGLLHDVTPMNNHV